MVQSVPRDGDVYLIKTVLASEPDDRAVAVLRKCVEAMAIGGRILVIDIVMPSGDEPSPSRAMVLVMLTLARGRVRTESEFRALFTAGGLSLSRLIPTNSISNPLSILEGVPA